MSLFPPIPLALLPDVMEVKVPADSDMGGEYERPVTVSNVRFVGASEIKPSKYAMNEDSKGVVFMDAANSQGAFEFPAGSLVAIGGVEMAAVKVTPLKTLFGKVHHWEVEVR